MRLSSCSNPISSKGTEASHYLGATFWVLNPPIFAWQTRIFLQFSGNDICDSAPNFVWIDLRVSRSWGLLFCFLSTALYLHGGVPQTTLLKGMLQDFFFQAFKTIDVWKCWQYLLLRDCILSLLLKSKVGSIISFSV